MSAYDPEAQDEERPLAVLAGQVLRLTRATYADRQRRMGLFQRVAQRLRQPAWMRATPDDQLRLVYQDQWPLRKRGRVHWGHIIQANTLLFAPGPHDHPAAVLWSPDEWYDDHLDELARIASSLYSLKGEQTGDAELQRFADLLADERTRKMRLVIPRALTGGRAVFYTTVMVHRRELPVPWLKTPFFPLLTPHADGVATMLMPARDWPDALRRLWVAVGD
jgi:hypothetical protein